MRKYIIFMTILFITQLGVAQKLEVKSLMTKSELEQIENAVDLYWKWNKDEDPLMAVEELEEFTRKHPKNWVASYWASYISTQISNSIKDKEEYLDRAQEFYDQSERALGEEIKDSVKYAYYKGLQSLIYQLKSFGTKDVNVRKELQAKATLELNAAIKLNSHNPVILVLSATDNTFDFRNSLSHRIACLALLKEAKVQFGKIKNRSKADISYWNEHWVDTWIKRFETR